tara:strand:+ start:4082 stop:4369 length:288 start_codon:yes stop_codon:yes gene_type:complete
MLSSIDKMRIIKFSNIKFNNQRKRIEKKSESSIKVIENNYNKIEKNNNKYFQNNKYFENNKYIENNKYFENNKYLKPTQKGGGKIIQPGGGFKGN